MTETVLPPPIQHAIDAALDKKAFDVVALDLRPSHAFTDFFVLCSGHTSRQVRAIVEAVEQRLKVKDTRPSHIEGLEQSQWVLIDCFDFVIHVFTEDTRRFYDLERLWGSAKHIAPTPAGKHGNASGNV